MVTALWCPRQPRSGIRVVTTLDVVPMLPATAGKCGHYSLQTV
jgi:hypothetical protein